MSGSSERSRTLSGIGTALGVTAGIMAAPVTGGASLAVIPALAGTAAGVGGGLLSASDAAAQQQALLEQQGLDDTLAQGMMQNVQASAPNQRGMAMLQQFAPQQSFGALSKSN